MVPALLPESVIDLGHAKWVVSIAVLAVCWSWESWLPYFGGHAQRWRHAGRNLTVALVNTAILAVIFGTALATVADWVARERLGLLQRLNLNDPGRLLLALVLLDAWSYLWHRANHFVPFLWRFHRMHHSDPAMDVTTATRFHLGEHLGASVLRLALIPLLGLELAHLLVYDTLLVAVTMFHHADISLGRVDRWLRWLIVTPDMHKVHHSDWRPETDSNYATVLSVWDRLAGTFRMRADLKSLRFGLTDFAEADWQTVRGMLVTPLATPEVSRNATDASVRAAVGP